MAPHTRASTHGHERIQQRLGLPSRAVDRAVANALARGKKRTEFIGPLRKYLDQLWRNGIRTNAATDIVVYGSAVYLFKKEVLVTTWNLPSRFIEATNDKKCSGSASPEDGDFSS